MLRKLTVIASFGLLGLAALTGCANPADDVPAAEVGAATGAGEDADGTRFVIDEASTIAFVGSKITGSHDGGFRRFEGAITLAGSDPERSRVEILIDTTSLWADNEKLTGHLKSADFFEVETYPAAKFESKKIVRDGDQYRITGDLTLHGITKSVTFPARIEVRPDLVAATAEFSIKRFDFGIVYKGKADDLIRDEVVVRLDLKAKPAAAVGA